MSALNYPDISLFPCHFWIFLGTDQTYQRSDLGSYGTAFKVVPMYTEKRGNYKGCWYRNGTRIWPIIPQPIIPNITEFEVNYKNYSCLIGTQIVDSFDDFLFRSFIRSVICSFVCLFGCLLFVVLLLVGSSSFIDSLTNPNPNPNPKFNWESTTPFVRSSLHLLIRPGVYETISFNFKEKYWN